MKKCKITNLLSGGIITNYSCSSACKHCLYNCSPNWQHNYMNVQTAESIFEKLKTFGCETVHIGGGEPFLDIKNLIEIVKCAQENEIEIEYIETNSSWYNTKDEALKILSTLKDNGVKKILISISPFHNEYIPFCKVKSVIAACEETNIEVFPWVYDFYDDINCFDDTKTHSLKEYINHFGEDYVYNIPSRYWIAMRGRAAKTFSGIFPVQKTEDILKLNTECHELVDTSHFHIDYDGNYVPGLCSGLAIDCKDIGVELDSKKYPIISMLYMEGIKGLTEYAINNFEFKAKEYYLNKCHLCFEIRKFIVLKGLKFRDIQPIEYYHNI